MADIVETHDDHIERLERNVDNMATELKVQAGMQDTRGTADCSEGDKAHARVHGDSGSAESIGTVDEIEALGGRVDDINQQLKDAVSAVLVIHWVFSAFSHPAASPVGSSPAPEIPSGLQRPVDQQHPFMGPVQIPGSKTPLQALRIHMNARLPKFAFPEPSHLEVILDPMQANHLRIIMSSASVRALRNAWVQRGNNSGSIKMVATGINDVAGSYALASGLGTSGNGYPKILAVWRCPNADVVTLLCALTPSSAFGQPDDLETLRAPGCFVYVLETSKLSVIQTADLCYMSPKGLARTLMETELN
ncbi:hypothetical protein B0H13DRAFT_2497148 [Mycena leptocephala]|nr:hypothetical protein B0H13DRAFT_2497148 [Mycena leptocephala]